MNSFFIKFKRNICYYAGGFFRLHKWRLLILFSVFLTGLILGIVVCNGSEQNGATGNYLILIRSGEYNIIGSYFKQMLLFSICFAIVILAQFNKWFICLPWGVVFFLGYRCGFYLLAMILENRFLGILGLIMYLLPFYLCAFFTLSVAICRLHQVIERSGYFRRCNITCRGTLINYTKYLLCCYIVFVCVNIIILLIIPSIAKFILVI